LVCAIAAVLWTMIMFLRMAKTSINRRTASAETPTRSLPLMWITEDRFWAGLLCSWAIFMMYYFK